MISHDVPVKGSRLLVLGLTFKENCPDLRNTKVVDLIADLESYGIQVDVHDPWASSDQAGKLPLTFKTELPEFESYCAIVLAVAHDQFRPLEKRIQDYCASGGVLHDLKGFFRPR